MFEIICPSPTKAKGDLGDMTINIVGTHIEISAVHLYLRGFGWEALWDFRGTVGSSLNRV